MHRILRIDHDISNGTKKSAVSFPSRMEPHVRVVAVITRSVHIKWQFIEDMQHMGGSPQRPTIVPASERSVLQIAVIQ